MFEREFMKSEVLLPLIFAVLLLMADVALFIIMMHLVKKNKDNTVENFGNKLKPLLYTTGIVSVLMAICMIIVVIIK